MINLTTILNDLLGAALVVAVLIAAAIVIKLIASAVNRTRNKRPVDSENIRQTVPAPERSGLKLINVDEKTAALIMAIVSHESGIPLSELIFTSIKLV